MKRRAGHPIGSRAFKNLKLVEIEINGKKTKVWIDKDKLKGVVYMKSEEEVRHNLKQWYQIMKDENNNEYQSKLTITIINTLRWVLDEEPIVK